MDKRNYGIDLLKLLLMFMISILHILGKGGILESSVEPHVYRVYWALEIICFCAVNSFAFITGYMAKEKEYSNKKIIDMWSQVLFYSLALTLILNPKQNILNIVKMCLPVTFNKYWYFTAYVPLFFIKPFINKYAFSLDEEKSKKSFILIFILFSVINIINDSFKLASGYSPLWLIILYILGILCKKGKIFENIKSIHLLLIFIASATFTWETLIYYDIGRLINYTSPTILLNGIILTIIFYRLNINKFIISRISRLSFGIYLFQCNEVIWTYLDKRFVFISKLPIYKGLLYIFGIACVICILGLLIEFIRKKIYLFVARFKQFCYNHFARQD